MRKLIDYVDWFSNLKLTGVTKDEILDVLEFDSDDEIDAQDINLMEQAKEIVYGTNH